MMRTGDLTVRMEGTGAEAIRIEVVVEAGAVVEATTITAAVEGVALAVAEVVVIEGGEAANEEVTSPLTMLGEVVDVTIRKGVSRIMMITYLVVMGIMLRFRL